MAQYQKQYAASPVITFSMVSHHIVMQAMDVSSFSLHDGEQSQQIFKTSIATTLDVLCVMYIARLTAYQLNSLTA